MFCEREGEFENKAEGGERERERERDSLLAQCSHCLCMGPGVGTPAEGLQNKALVESEHAPRFHVPARMVFARFFCYPSLPRPILHADTEMLYPCH